MMANHQRLKCVRDELGSAEILAALAEEAAELAHAALKLRRAVDGADPTPKSEDECLDSLIEEISDVMLICNAFGLEADPAIMDMKLDRWIMRLHESQ